MYGNDIGLMIFAIVYKKRRCSDWTDIFAMRSVTTCTSWGPFTSSLWRPDSASEGIDLPLRPIGRIQVYDFNSSRKSIVGWGTEDSSAGSSSEVLG